MSGRTSDCQADENFVVDRAAAGIAVIAALVLVTAIVWGIWHRGPWYDDFYSWFVTDPARSFADGLRRSWLVDNHPPLFYMLVWVARHIASSIEQARLIGPMAIIAGALAGWIVIRRERQWHLLACGYFLILAANPWVPEYGTELRSYLISVVVSGVVLLTLTVGWLKGGLDRSQRMVLTGGLLVGFNIHILSSIILGAIVFCFIIAAWFSGRRPFALAILARALPAGAIFVAVCLVQVPLWWSNTTHFWLPKEFSVVRWSVEFSVINTITANPLALGIGLIGAGLLSWGFVVKRRLPSRLGAALVIGCGLVLAVMVIAGLQLVRPMVIERYLAALIPPVAMLVALGFSEVLGRIGTVASRIALAVAFGMTGWAIVENTQDAIRLHSWLPSAALAARIQHACPDAPIHIDPAFWNAYSLSLPPADNHMVLEKSYAYTIRRENLRVEPRGSRRLAALCPTLFWAEHDVEKRSAQAILDRLRAQGFAIDRIWIVRQGFGWVASNQPFGVGVPAG